MAITEMIRGGTTTFTDMYFFPEDAARVSFDAGIRIQLAAPVLEFPSAYGNGADDYISKALALRDAVKSEPLATERRRNGRGPVMGGAGPGRNRYRGRRSKRSPGEPRA